MFGSTNPFRQSSSSPFGSQSVSGQPSISITNPFGSSSSQSTPFGCTFQQSQPAFGSILFGSSTPPGASTQPAFGAAITPAFGAASSPAFGATTAPAFGSTTTPAFGSASTPIFGSTGAEFGASSTRASGSTGTPAFGAPSTSVFGSSSTPAFGASSTSSFSLGFIPSFATGKHCSMKCNHIRRPAKKGFRRSSFRSQPGGSRITAYTPTPEVDTCVIQPVANLLSISAMHAYKDKAHEELRWEDHEHGGRGAQATIPLFGSLGFAQSAFGGQVGGSRITAYTLTPEVDAYGTQLGGFLESISAMQAYKDKSHEELRWEDYQHKVKTEEAVQTEEAQPQETSQPTKSATLAAGFSKAPALDKGRNPSQPQEAVQTAEPVMPVGSSQSPLFKEDINPSVQPHEAILSATGSTQGQILKEGQNPAQPQEAVQSMEPATLAASLSQALRLYEGLNPAWPQEAVPPPEPGAPAASLSQAPMLDEVFRPAMLTPPGFSHRAEASSCQTLTKQVVAWAHLKGDVNTIKKMLQEQPVPTDHVEELLQNMIAEENLSGYCFKGFRACASQILNEIKRQQSMTLGSVMEELTAAKCRELSSMRQSVNRHKSLMRDYEKELDNETNRKAELVKNRGEIRTRMTTLEQELEQAKTELAENEAQIQKQDEAISKARASMTSLSREIQKAEEESKQAAESFRVGEEAEAKMRKQLEGLKSSIAVLLKFEMPQCLPRIS